MPAVHKGGGEEGNGGEKTGGLQTEKDGETEKA